MGPTVLVVSVNQILVKVSKITSNVKNVSCSLVVPTCNDTVMNANETGVDCGGWCAPEKECSDFMGCRDTNDCISGVCTANFCQGSDRNRKVKYQRLSIVAPTCNDHTRNGNETDVDCGGSCLLTKKCADGLRCNSGPDCNSGVCRSKICQGEYRNL